MSHISLRLADRADAPLLFSFLQKLALQLGSTENFKGSLQAFEKFGFGDRPAFEAIIAYREDLAVGCILYFEEFSTWRCSPGIYVQDLFVDAGARGLGVGKRLIDAAAQRGQKALAGYLRLSVDADNQAGLEFYKAIGFKHRKNEKIMMLDIEQGTTKIKEKTK